MISMISTSSAPPRSGTLISCSLMADSLAQHRVRFVAIDSILAHGFENLFLLDLAIFRQGRQCGHGYVETVYLEEAAQLLAGITAAKAVGAQSHVDRKSTRLNSSHVRISYAVFCLKKKK